MSDAALVGVSHVLDIIIYFRAEIAGKNHLSVYTIHVIRTFSDRIEHLGGAAAAGLRNFGILLSLRIISSPHQAARRTNVLKAAASGAVLWAARRRKLSSTYGIALFHFHKGLYRLSLNMLPVVYICKYVSKPGRRGPTFQLHLLTQLYCNT